MPSGAYAGPFGLVPFHRIYRAPPSVSTGPSGPIWPCGWLRRGGLPGSGEVDGDPGCGEGERL